MPSGQLDQFLRRYQHDSAAGTDDQTDAQLLQRFATNQDGAAFEMLVQRHGPMVLGLCRRLLHNATDAEDAFQATFLILARRAGSIRKPESLSSHGFYAATFDMVVGPAKPIVGTVRDKDTGNPLAGIVIEDGRGKGRAVTDNNGRYRLPGVAKQTEYALSAGGGAGRRL